jgi:hypothetical protein
MPYSKLRFFKRCAEFLSKDLIRDIPLNTRGIYSLMIKKNNIYETVYIGMAGGEKAGIRGRILSHSKSNKKNKDKNTSWTHFSIYEVFDNINNQEIREIEGIMRHIYSKSNSSISQNRQRSYKGLTNIKDNDIKFWK